jgi:hypothetical protein
MFHKIKLTTYFLIPVISSKGKFSRSFLSPDKKEYIIKREPPFGIKYKPEGKPDGLDANETILWEILQKKIKKEYLSPEEIYKLEHASPAIIFKLTVTLRNSYEIPSFIKEQDVILVRLNLKYLEARVDVVPQIIQNKSTKFVTVNSDFESLNFLGKHINFYFIVTKVEGGFLEQELAIFFKNEIWEKNLSNLYSSDVVLESIQLKLVFPKNRINALFSFPFVESGKLDPEIHVPNSKSFIIRMGSKFFSNAKDDNTLRLGFISKQFMVFNHENVINLRLYLDSFLEFLRNPVEIKTFGSKDTITNYAEFFLALQTKNPHAPAVYLVADSLAATGFVGNSRAHGLSIISKLDYRNNKPINFDKTNLNSQDKEGSVSDTDNPEGGPRTP